MPNVTQLDESLHLIDLNFRGQPGVIGAYLIDEDGERAIIETGPTSTLDTLLDALRGLGIDPQSVSKLLVTHIHLDHAGASGTWMRRFPNARLYVHENGARHMIDPSHLLASATRIYGDMIGPLWGEVEPVPEERLTVLRDGDTVTVGSRPLQVLYTPGHASHHVIFHDRERRLVFTGDIAAVRLQGVHFVRPPTPPPDIDLELWSTSLDRIAALDPRALLLTHFGPSEEVAWHLKEARERLYEWGEIVRRAQESGQDRPEITDTLRLHGDSQLLELTDDGRTVLRYDLTAAYGMSADGYLRYLRGRTEAVPGS